MKSRLAASVYLLSASKGKWWVNTRSKVPSRSIFAIFDRGHGQIDSSFHARGFESSNRAVHSSALDEDDFSELGPGVSECSTKKIELVTKKLDDFMDDEVSLEMDPGISEWSDQEIELVTEKSDAFLDDDTFSELGPERSEVSAKKLNLVTEKRDHFLRTHSHKRELPSRPLSSDYKDLVKVIARSSTTSSTKSRARINALAPTDNKESGSKSLSSDYRPNVKEGFEAIAKSSTASSPKPYASDHAPTSTDDKRKISETKDPLSVSIKNIPSEVGLPELLEAISVFGKVSGASFVTASDKFKCCYIEFEDADSSRRAASAGKVEVGSHVFLVNPLDAVDLVAVRIININGRTTDSAVHSICKSAGELVGLTRTSRNCVDAFFNVRNHLCHLDIVKKLNNTVCELNHWSARELTSISNSLEARYKLHSQICDRYAKLSTEFSMKRVYLQDLENLNTSLMHLQDISPALNQSGKQRALKAFEAMR